MGENKKNIAVIGGGVAGIMTAYLLQKKFNVTLYEKNDYLGGHTHTIMVDDVHEGTLPVDTGFIVFNNKTYPNLLNFFKQLSVEKEATQMSFSYFDPDVDHYYASDALFAQKRNLFSLKHWRFLIEMLKFCKQTEKLFFSNSLHDITLGEFLKKYKYSNRVRDQFIVPMAGAIWSSSFESTLQFPMESFARFYTNHGLLNIFKHPTWYYVKGGSHSYVKKFKEIFSGTIIIDNPVTAIKRLEKTVQITSTKGGKKIYDKVVIAAHADQALRMITNPTKKETELLQNWSYSRNRIVLHSDTSFMPQDKKLWAAWNYINFKDIEANSPVSVTYYMNLLQKIKSDTPYLVTLNPQKEICADKIIGEYDYEHPIFDFAAINTQKELPELNKNSDILFCGSYFSYGFHEHAVRSAVDLAKVFGIEL